MSQDLNEDDLMFKLIKIYIVEYLTAVHGFKNFQHEAINILATYVIKIIQKMAISIKRTVSLQGRTLANPLHIVNAIQSDKTVDIFDLIQFLNKQPSSTSKQVQVFYAGLDNLSKSLFSEETQQVNLYKPQNTYPNIKYIPYVYCYNPEDNSLPIKLPVDEGLKKPAEYTYKNISDRVEKVDQSIQKLGNYSVREMRRSLGILNNQQQQENRGQKPRKITALQHQKQGGYTLSKNKFSMINYI